jgi:DNA helicase-4
VDELRDSSETFRYRWDLYRTVFAQAPTDLELHEPDGYDKETRETGYQTFAGDVVKSHSERLIANFLFLNGVEYHYEQPYIVDTATPTHSQYRPDFYYPGIEVWHEHWALDRNGKPPNEFRDYEAGMAWKRRTHASNGTALIETTWADVMWGDGLERLRAELTNRGVELDWNPDRPISNRFSPPLKHEDLAGLVRTFMTHVKSNSWTREDLDRRLQGELSNRDGYRTRLFLDIYWPIHDAWQDRLQADSSVDFEDMLVQAATHLEQGVVQSPFELILVDEFQDASRARARLVAGLLREPNRYLLAVGDDWQSINRFAGADVSVMTDFTSWFGRGPQLALTTTFRCPQPICDVASSFVAKNPAQFTKQMRSTNPDHRPAVRVIRSENQQNALADYLNRLSQEVSSASIEPAAAGTVTVDVLGRYGFQKDQLPQQAPEHINLRFRTIHGAKGLEADFIVVLGLGTGTYGFPSNIADDPVLEVAMPTPETFEHAEERRLLYVALTRARREVVLITPSTQISPFVIELLDHPGVTVEGDNGDSVEVCARCRRGIMTQRNGAKSPFLGCTNFPACQNTRNLGTPSETHGSCARCGTGTMTKRRGRHGSFLGCTNYPTCSYTRNL